jgi:SAM-dependent methyltransferase
MTQPERLCDSPHAVPRASADKEIRTMNAMKPVESDRSFAGSIPMLYEQLLVPLIFAPYARDLAARVSAVYPRAVLELAAGTGVVTREMARGLPADCEIVASDLNQAMIDHAATIGTARPVQWCRADAMHLPFADESCEAVVCQFGVMFFPDKPAALAEARRVLRPGGMLLFNVWDRIEANELADVVTTALETLFPNDPPRFLARTPHGYHDKNQIAADVVRAGFRGAASIDTVAARSIADSAWTAAMAYCQGTPLRNEIEARAAVSLDQATEHAAQAIARRFGAEPVDGAIQAHVVSATK